MNAPLPGLQEILEALDVVEFVHPAASNCGSDPIAWPQDVLDNLTAIGAEWALEREKFGRVEIIARQCACVAIAGRWWAVMRLHYLVHRFENSPESLPARAVAAAAG